MSTYLPPVGSILRLGAEPHHHAAVVVDPWGSVLEVKRNGKRCAYHHDSPEEWQTATGVDLSVDYRVEARPPRKEKTTVERVAAALRKLVSRDFTTARAIIAYPSRVDELYLLDAQLDQLDAESLDATVLRRRVGELWALLTDEEREGDVFDTQARGVSMARSRLTVIVEGVPRSLTVGTVCSGVSGYTDRYEGRQMLLCGGRIGPTYESVGIPEEARVYRTLSDGTFEEIAWP
jgi:hypothetical protein